MAPEFGYASIDGFEVDAMINEDHVIESDITDNPVEKGANFTDHVRLRPRRYVCEGVISNTPIGPIATKRAALGGKPAELFRAHCEGIVAKPRPILVVTSTKRYENMILETISMPENIGVGEACRFRATFKQIRIVSNEKTTVEVALPRQAKKQSRGNKPTKPATPSKKTYTGVKKYRDSWGGQLAQKLGALDGFGDGTEMVED